MWRFMRKHQDAFALRRFPGSFGCVIFNAQYPDGQEYDVPSSEGVVRIWIEMRKTETNTHIVKKPARFVVKSSRVF